jgi:NAD(P)-dependent dehydrogenase (short-subunit alcohol dehydrogenase family)
MRRSSTAVATLIADLSSQGSVRRLAAEVLARYPKLDVLVNNAGAMYGTRQLTKDGIELTWAVNHLAPFLLSKLLLHRLKESAPARIIAAASQAHYRAHIPFDDLKAERSYRGFGGYCETKLANLLFTTELARRLDGTGVTANCFHPGLVATGFNNNGLLMNLGMTILRPQHGCRARSLLRDRANVRRTAVLFQLRIHDRFPPHPRHCALSSYVAMGQLCCWMVKNVAVAHCTRCSTDNRGSNSPSVLVRAHSRRIFSRALRAGCIIVHC